MTQNDGEDHLSPMLSPMARADGLVVEEVGEEAIVYDLDADRVHHLNRAAFAVWRSCDGRTVTTDIARVAHQMTGLPCDLAIVESALEQLGEAALLLPNSAPGASDTSDEQPPAARHTGDGHLARSMTARSGARGMSRRRALALGAAAGLAPVVTSIIAPTPAMAASRGRGQVPSGVILGDAQPPCGFTQRNGKVFCEGEPGEATTCFWVVVDQQDGKNVVDCKEG